MPTKKKTTKKKAVKHSDDATVVETLSGYRFQLGKELFMQEVAIGEDPNDTDGLYYTPRAEIAGLLRALDNGGRAAFAAFRYYVIGSGIGHVGSAYMENNILNIGCMEFNASAQAKMRTWAEVPKPRARKAA